MTPTPRHLEVLSHLYDSSQSAATLALSLCVTRQRAHQLAQRVVSLGWARQAAAVYRLTPSGTRTLLASRAAQRAFDSVAKPSK